MDESPKRNFRPNKAQTKTLLVWVSLIAIIAMLKVFSDSYAVAPQKYEVKQVLKLADDDMLKTLVFERDPSSPQNWYKMQGTIKNPAFGKPDADKNTPRELPFTSEGTLTESAYQKLTTPDAPWTVQEKLSSSWGGIVISFLPFILILAVGWFLFSRYMRTNKSAMNFGKSRARLLSPDKDRITFNDVAGCDEAKEEVSEIVDFLRTPDKFNTIGARIPKGILMVGPPGTGKTLIARAIAGEANVPFYSISGSDFVEMFVGVGAARVRDMFDQARKSAPCLVFIDEIDAVGRQRGAGLGGGNDEREQTLNSLLVEMDGFDGHEGIIIIAATNRPDVLDSALLRPGRFDRQVVIDLPDAKGREEILKIHTKKIKIESDVDLARIAKLAPGTSGADLANLVNEAAITAARRGSKTVANSDFEVARDKVFYGRERRRLMTLDEKKLIAYHEAGHALVQADIDTGIMPVHKVTIIPRGQSLGSTMFLPERDVLLDTKGNLLNRICATLGGRAAEELVFNEITNGASSDISSVTKTARKMVCDWGMSPLGPIALGENQDHIFLGREIARETHYSEQTAQLIDAQVKKIVDSQHERAKEIISSKRSALDVMAGALVELETIDRDLVYAIVQGKITNLPDAVRFHKTPEVQGEKPSKESETISPKIGEEAAQL